MKRTLFLCLLLDGCSGKSQPFTNAIPNLSRQASNGFQIFSSISITNVPKAVYITNNDGWCTNIVISSIREPVMRKAGSNVWEVRFEP